MNYWFWFPTTRTRHRYLAEMARHGIWFLDTVNMVAPGMPLTPCAAELLPEAAGRKTLDTQDLVDRYQSLEDMHRELVAVVRRMPTRIGVPAQHIAKPRRLDMAFAAQARP